MNFKRIELVGFKSFADKTVVDFNDGITAIVGPNGCGKSNVADAIRWVLGEQSSKVLRGSSMQDVIFNGTEKRKSLSYCEVSIVLDNTMRSIDLDYDEITLSRKLYRSGESEYLINKNPARRKDIIDILHDSGIGRDGYSIIGQGKVEEIVSSKPENRRAIFEEAAGIAKFKEKKIESERKLERTHENLSRVNDIIYEIERKLNPLKEQAETAKKYLSLKESMKLLEINNYIYQYDSAASRKEDIALKIKAIEEETLNRQNDLEVANISYNKTFEEINNIDNSMRALYNEIANIKVEIEKQSGETHIQTERLNLLKEQAKTLEDRIKKEEERLELLDLELDKKKLLQEENNLKSEDLKEEIANLNNRYEEILDELTQYEEESEENQQLMLDALDKLSDIKADISKLRAEEELSREQKSKILQNLNVTKEIISRNTLSLNQIKEKISSLSQQKIEEEDKKISLTKLIDESKQSLTKNTLRFNEIMSAYSSLSSRQKVLDEMQKSFDGFNGAVKRILQDSQTNLALKNQFVGVVANLMTVPKEYETAIEMALGGAVQNVVTENEENANKIIAYLKQNNYGRATFLPITSLKPRNLRDYLSVIQSTNGCFGVASNLITFDSKYSNIFENLLGSTVIVKDLVVAVNLAKQTRYGFKIVTLDGDIINPQGSITGGSKKMTVSNIVGRDREIAEITKNLKALENEKNTLDKLIDDTENLINVKSNELDTCVNNLHKIELDLTSSNESAQNINNFLEISYKQQETYNSELLQLDAKLKAIEISLKETQSNQLNLDSNRQVANENINKKQSSFLTIKKERDEYNQKITDLKVKIASLESETAAIGQDIERLLSEKDDTTLALSELRETLSNNNSYIENANRIIARHQHDEVYIELSKKLDNTQNQINELEKSKVSLQEKLRELEADRLSLQTNINKLQDRKYQEDLNLTKIDTDIENMQERIYEEYELNYSSAMQYKIEDYDLNQGLIDANKTRREIDKLGHVNVNAIEEVKLEQERYDELSTSATDLMKAEEDLKTIINELALEMTTRFDAAFNQINNNFSKIFRELFGGGNSSLILVPAESGDPLDAGVDIIAEPPGKKPRNITLLSGGEKALTAIAILFSILKLRPMPFVLLDEIEAALDEANVGRFAKYLKRFSGETQFIVITHRKPTMELADRLYGVTMQEKGVSSILSVELADAVNSTDTK